MIVTLEAYFSQYEAFEVGFEALGWFGDKVVYGLRLPRRVCSEELREA